MKRITSILVFLAFLGLSVFGQEIQITGKVTSAEDGSALPGVSVIKKGTNTGVSTDVDGNYSISAASDATLIFSSIGMESQEVLVGGQTVIDVALEPEAIAMDEVVVTALGIQRSVKALGYSATQVGEDEIQVIGFEQRAVSIVRAARGYCKTVVEIFPKLGQISIPGLRIGYAQN